MNRIHKISIFAASSAVAVLAYAVSTPSNKAATTAVKQDQVLTNQQVSTPSTTTANSSPTVLAPTLTSTTTASPIKNQYIVVLQAGSDLPAQAAAAIAKQHGGKFYLRITGRFVVLPYVFQNRLRQLSLRLCRKIRKSVM